MCVVSNTLECPEASLNRQFPPTSVQRSNPVTSKPRSKKFLIVGKPAGPAPITATVFFVIRFLLFVP